MDFRKDEKSLLIEEKPRPVLVTSEKNNAVPANGKPRAREITSRYKLGTTPSPRAPSPNPRTSVSQRAQSAERRRPTTPSSPPSRRSTPSSPTSTTPLSKSSRPSSPSSSRPCTPSSPSSRSTTPVRDTIVGRPNSSRRSLVGRAPDGLWPSIRSLSASFQSESSSVLASKSDRPIRNPSPDHTLKSSPNANATSERKRTPLRGRNASDQLENSKPAENSHVRAIDQLRWPGMIGGKVSSRSMDLSDKISRSASLSASVRGLSPTRGMSLKNSTNEMAPPVSSKGSEKVATLSRNTVSLPSDRAPSITRQGRSPSPVPSLIRPSSPNKGLMASPFISRGLASPLRSRPSTPPLSSSSSNTSTRVGVSSSILNYMADVRKGKRSPSHLEDAHQLRLLYNRELQWRFVNARADAAFSTQKLIVEDMLYNVWNITSQLCDSIMVKRMYVQNLRQDMMLKSILKDQIAYLEDWGASEAEHSTSMLGTIEALKASTLRLPVTRGARADLRAVKNSISSAVDVMQAMGSSICYLLSRMDATNPLVSELSEVAATESIMLDECRELLASTAAMQVQECSLRTQLIQLRQDVQAE